MRNAQDTHDIPQETIDRLHALNKELQSGNAYAGKPLLKQPCLDLKCEYLCKVCGDNNFCQLSRIKKYTKDFTCPLNYWNNGD